MSKSKRSLPTIGIVCPSFRPHQREIQAAADVLASVGFKVKLGPVAKKALPTYNQPFHNLINRVAEMDAMLRDPEVDILWAADGGMGSGYVLDALCKMDLPPSPKTFIGFSDVTFWTTYLGSRGALCFQGCNAIVDEENDESQLRHVAEKLADLYSGRVSPVVKFEQPADVYQEGYAEGPLYAGNFSILQTMALARSAISPDLTHAILVMEEHGSNAPGEREYIFWQQLQTLQLSGRWQSVGGFALGDIPTGGPYETTQDLFPPLAEVIEKTFPTFTKGPIVSGFDFSSDRQTDLIPSGVRASMTAADGHVILTVDLSKYLAR
jgi:muramoyltetrapeptide carboxypeptidase LdcA involved in peptidoglycan recycling